MTKKPKKPKKSKRPVAQGAKVLQITPGKCAKCGDPTEGGKLWCPRHASARNEIIKKNAKRKVLKGECAFCSEPAVPGFRQCKRHREEAAKRRENRRALARANFPVPVVFEPGQVAPGDPHILPPLIDWIPLVSKHLAKPVHLSVWCDVLERAARGESVRALCALPIRHYKSVTAFHGIAWALRQNPKLRIIYMTYGKLYANTRGREIRDLCARVGVEIQPGHSTIHEWRTTAGGGVVTMSATSSALGQDVDILLVDDPFEGMIEANDPNIQERVDDTIAFYTARLNRGGSCIIVMSRFAPGDAIGRRQERTAEPWENLHQSALCDEGLPSEHAFAPNVRTVEELKQIRAAMAEKDPKERVWHSQWQNNPISEKGEYFGPAFRYDSIPTYPGFRTAIGIDLAYTEKHHSDFFALVVLKIYANTAYVAYVKRFKADLLTAEAEIRSAYETYGRAPIYSYMSATEKGAAFHFTGKGLPVTPMPAKYNKLVRSQKTRDFWNTGKILVPMQAPWLRPFLQEIEQFRGNDKDYDDQVDALVSAVDGALFSSVTAPTRLPGGKWRI